MAKQLYIELLDENLISTEYLNWMNDPEVLKFTESRGKSYSIEDLKSFVSTMRLSKKDYLFGIYLTDSKKHIGNIKIGNINKEYSFADVGIILGLKEEWGKGYATIAINLVIDYAFNVLKLDKLTAGAYSDNIGSIKALKKVGFRESSRYVYHHVYENSNIDVLKFEIINTKIKD